MDDDARQRLIQETHLALMTFCQTAKGLRGPEAWPFQRAAEEFGRLLMAVSPNILVADADHEMEARCTTCSMSMTLPMPDGWTDEDGHPVAVSPGEAESRLKAMLESLACPHCGTHTFRVE
jgi:hypothetical protein